MIKKADQFGVIVIRIAFLYGLCERYHFLLVCLSLPPSRRLLQH